MRNDGMVIKEMKQDAVLNFNSGSAGRSADSSMTESVEMKSTSQLHMSMPCLTRTLSHSQLSVEKQLFDMFDGMLWIPSDTLVLRHLCTQFITSMPNS